MRRDLDESLLMRVHRVFSDAGLEYALVGRTAAALWGGPRVEREVELLARIGPGEVDGLLAAASAQGFEVDPGLAALATEGGDHLTLFPGGEAFVDVKPARGAGDLAALRTRVELPVARGEVAVCTVEETIARLLDEGGVEALDAARRILEQHTERIDGGFLGQRCEELGVAYLLRDIGGEVLPAAH